VEDLDISIYVDESELVSAVISDITDLISSGLEQNGTFHLALTGGTLGNLISKNLAEQFSVGNWNGLHIWWSDERFVPLNSPERNDLAFLSNLTNAEIKFHRVMGDDVEAAAEFLAKEIKGIDLDLIILGMGPDGHVASLFPGAIHADEKREVFAITDSPKPPSERVTFSLKKINSAKAIWLVASGAGKADAVAGLIEEDMKLPVSHVNLSRLLVDSESFGI
jgi:6-phosphogluconolactonase